MVVQVEEAVPVERWWISDDVDDENACFVPLRPGGPLTRVYCAADVPEFREKDCVWNGRVPVGCLTAIVGPRGVGKSFLIAEIAARLSNGDPWPDDPDTPGDAGETLIITLEDHIPKGITRRLRACGADLSCVHIVDFRDENGKPGTLTGELVEQMIERLYGIQLVVIDPFSNLIGQENGRPPGEIKALLQELAALAEQRGIGIIVVNATDKASAGKAGRNSADVLAFLDAGARAVWIVEEDPGAAGRFLWLPSRMNVGEAAEGLAFRVEGRTGKVVWDAEPVALRADDLKPAAQRRVTKAAAAGDWLHAFLVAGARPSAEVLRAAGRAGITRGALYDAKGQLGVMSVKESDTANGSWSWQLPEETAVSPEDSKILMRFFRSLNDGLRAQLAAVDDDGIGCDTLLRNPPPQGWRGPENASEGDARCDTPQAHSPAQDASGPKYRELPADSKVLAGRAPAVRQVVEDPRTGSRNAIVHATLETNGDVDSLRALNVGAGESEDLPEDSKNMEAALTL